METTSFAGCGDLRAMPDVLWIEVGRTFQGVWYSWMTRTIYPETLDDVIANEKSRGLEVRVLEDPFVPPPRFGIA